MNDGKLLLAGGKAAIGWRKLLLAGRKAAIGWRKVTIGRKKGCHWMTKVTIGWKKGCHWKTNTWWLTKSNDCLLFKLCMLSYVIGSSLIDGTIFIYFHVEAKGTSIYCNLLSQSVHRSPKLKCRSVKETVVTLFYKQKFQVWQYIFNSCLKYIK